MIAIAEKIRKRTVKSPNSKTVSQACDKIIDLISKDSRVELYAFLRANEILFFDDLRPKHAIPKDQRRKKTRPLWEDLLDGCVNGYRESYLNNS